MMDKGQANGKKTTSSEACSMFGPYAPVFSQQTNILFGYTGMDSLRAEIARFGTGWIAASFLPA